MQSAKFKISLGEYKKQIEDALSEHSKQLHSITLKGYTAYSVAAVDAFREILSRGGKRLRGVLAMQGYYMAGGKDTSMIIQAACVIEMMHAYILILDDIMDKSAVRRGGPSAHVILGEYHKKQSLSGDSHHFGEAVAINAALIGEHYAQSVATSLNVNDANKLKALQLLNQAFVVTGHGQVNDIFNESVDEVTEHDVDNVLEWKTAHYTFLNPLQFGMALAGADNGMLELLRPFCMHAGRAFQITDDILGTFASEQEAGKSPMDDIREGKRTVLSVAALHRADSSDKNFLIQMLGNDKLTSTEFLRCKEIFVDTGALSEAQRQAADHIKLASKSLEQIEQLLQPEGVSFLRSTVQSLLGRSS